MFSTPKPDSANLKKFYDNADYYKVWGGLDVDNIKSVEKIKEKTFLRLLKFVKRYKSVGKILDIGCATGFLLDVFSKYGFEPYGTECCREFAEIAKNKFDEKIFYGNFEEANFDNNFFDVAVMFDVLEHMVNPVFVINKVFNILKKNGLFLIATPSIESLSFKIMGKYWTEFKKEHLFYFSRKSIRHLLEKRENFKIETIMPAVTALNLDYIVNYLKTFNFPGNVLLGRCSGIVPKQLKEKPFYTYSGDMLILARKE
jgi:2-polyprenyl-3-methyl-5-hydroxy-6-metoxy-1,4-benzoquinol methylase